MKELQSAATPVCVPEQQAHGSHVLQWTKLVKSGDSLQSGPLGPSGTSRWNNLHVYSKDMLPWSESFATTGWAHHGSQGTHGKAAGRQPLLHAKATPRSAKWGNIAHNGQRGEIGKMGFWGPLPWLFVPMGEPWVLPGCFFWCGRRDTGGSL